MQGWTPEVWIAFFTFCGLVAAPVITAVIAYFRDRGVQISIGQEAFIRDAVDEGILLAVELARDGGVSGDQRAKIAIKHAKRLIDKHGRIPTPSEDELLTRVNARLPAVLPGRSGVATAAVKAVEPSADDLPPENDRVTPRSTPPRSER